MIWDIGKDIAYFIKPILMLFIGYALIHRIKDRKFIFKVINSAGIAFAAYHIIRFLSFQELFHSSINTIRNTVGLSNHIELLALVFLLLGIKYPSIAVIKKGRIRNLILLLLITSFIFYFSRTMWVAILLILLASFGYAKISLKALKYIGLLVVLVGSFYIYLFSIEIERDKPGISSFLYKMKIAPEEIFSPKIDLNNHEALWDHWRAYEAKMAFDQTESLQNIWGKGFGSLVDLKFIAPLSDEGMRYISHLHNGYAMLYYKTGVLGLIFYILFVLNFYLYTFKRKVNTSEFPIRNLIAAIGIYLIFSTLTITGAYNISEIYVLVLGGLLAKIDLLVKPLPE